MKVLLINGSPNKNGCTYTALREVEKQLNENDIETELVQIGASAIRGCVGCGGCEKKSKCVFDNDSVNTVISKISECDGLIVGSPVYYASANGSLICLLDRVFFAAGKSFAHKPAAAVVSARRAGTTASLDELNKYFLISQMPIVSSQYWNMVHGSEPAEVNEDKEGLQIMRTLANNMAWLLRCIEAAKNIGIHPPAPEKRISTNFIR